MVRIPERTRHPWVHLVPSKIKHHIAPRHLLATALKGQDTILYEDLLMALASDQRPRSLKADHFALSHYHSLSTRLSYDPML